ncbi:MAG: FAD/NAD(P)-binding protein, partial [Deltaproteobacteria bacterium]|nr:FAD/NAD(P)-binding protein [Deltaproteobacteria bacterium]
MNVYQPHLMRIDEVVDETSDTRTLKLSFRDPKTAEGFAFQAGQFGEYSVFGSGECTFCIASSPTRKGFIECSFKKVGKVTTAMRQLGVGDTMGFRGPYGNAFPLDKWAGKSIVFIAGGIGLAPVRCVIWNALDLRDRFKDVTIVYGARRVGDLVYKRELDEWSKRTDIKFWQTVDPGGETKDWKGQIGFVPTIVEKAAPKAADAYAVVCGPPIMIKFTLPVLAKLGFPDDRIFTTLENRMKCGIGKCGRCNIGPVYVCKDGPVFTAAQLK